MNVRQQLLDAAALVLEEPAERLTVRDALVGVAARLQLEGKRVVEARLILSGVSPIPWRLTAAEQMLIGQRPDETTIARVAEVALAQAHPLQHNGYKVPLAQSLIRRALSELVGE